MSTTRKRIGQIRHVTPSAVKETERILNNYAERMEKLFTSKTAPVEYDNPKPKQLTKEQETAYLASEQYNTRARIYETGVAHVVGENYYGVTEVCITLLQDALRLRQEARAMMERAHRGVQ